jgi:transcriptional regulator with XRE-family HTH domain
MVTERSALSFAGLLRRLRAGARLTQEELAASAGVSLGSVSNLERGINRTAHKDTAVLLAGALGLTGPAAELFVAAARGTVPAAQVLAAAEGTRPRPAAVTGSPYCGLAAFEEQDAGWFFGREAAATAVLERMSRLLGGAGLLVVSGVSGAGKSSLLRAGVLPRIRAEGLAAAPGAAWWPCVLFTPTRAPLDELALRVAPLAGADASAVRRGLAADPAWFALTARQAALAAPPAPAEEPDGDPAQRDQLRQRRLLLVIDQFEGLFTQCPDEGQRRAFITALHAAATAGHGPDQAPAALVVLGVRADFEARSADYPQLADAIQDRYLVTAMTGRQLRMAITEPAKKADSGVDDDLTEVLLTEVRTGQPGTFGAGVLPLLSHALDQAWRSRTGETLTLADYERTGGIDGAVATSAQRVYDGLTSAQQAAARQVFLRLTATSSEGVDSADRVTRAELTEGKSPAEAQDVEAVLEAFAAERLLTLAAGTVEISHEGLLTAWPLLRHTWLADTHADRIVRTRLHATAAEWAHHSRDRSYLYSGSLLAAATGTATRIGADPARHPPLGRTERDFLHASSHAHRRTVHRQQGLAALLAALVISLTATTVLAVHAGQQVPFSPGGKLAIGGADGTVRLWNPPTGRAYVPLQTGPRPVEVVFSPSGELLAGGDGTVRPWHVAAHHPIGVPR